MTRQSHTFEGKSAGVFITSDGKVVHVNVENLTVICEDGLDYDNFYSYRLPPLLTYSLEGTMVELDNSTNSGIIFEIRSPVE